MQTNFELLKIAQLMSNFAYPWAFCGGWAIDLFLGRVTRPHKDVDIAILRRDQQQIRAYLDARGWTFEKAHQGKLSPWAENEVLQLPIHTIWCRHADFEPNFLELLFNEATDSHFLFRRNPSITLELDQAFLQSDVGLPILAPEIVLLYKANDASREENASDFRNMLPYLDGKRGAWLKAALERMHPDHEWLHK